MELSRAVSTMKMIAICLIILHCVLQSSTPSIANVIAVSNTNDSGNGSFRWALEEANNTAGSDTIVFHIPDIDPGYNSDTGVWTISPQSSLPYIEDDGTVIDASTQSVFTGADTNPFGPEIEIDGTSAVEFQISSNNNVLKQVVLNRFPNSGLYIWGADSNRVVGCYIGTDPTGTTLLGNGTNGITVNGRSSYNIIGGTGPDEWNLLSANVWDGLMIGLDCSWNTVINNFIGTDRTGANPLGNGETGITIGNGSTGDSARNNIIGPGNTIAFNGEYGIKVLGESVEYNTLTQNSIFGNEWAGIIHAEQGNNELDAPVVLNVSGSEVTGTACPECIVEIFSDSEDQGATYEGMTTADISGNFSFTGIVSGPFVTATATDPDGNTSEFSEPFSHSADIVVTNTNDSGEGSLRWAIDRANSHAGPDTILFNIPDTDPGYHPVTGVWTIQPLTIFPSLSTGGTVIDGTSQADFIGSDTNPHGPEIEIDGTNTAPWQTLLIVISSDNVIKGLVINRYDGYVIWLQGGATGNTICGNFLGTDVGGTVDQGNLRTPILIGNGAHNNVIGGFTAEERNIISGNDANGIRIFGTGTEYNRVRGNYIGVDAGGTSPLGNESDGIKIHAGARYNSISSSNVIACNKGDGIYVSDDTTTGNYISRNSITKNDGLGINNENGGNAELSPPVITSVTLDAVSGTACPRCEINVYSDTEDEGEIYEGSTGTDSTGNFTFTKSVQGPNVTATAIDGIGNTSEFSDPYVFKISIVVTHTGDSGLNSLRWAIALANAHSGPDTITFNIPDTDPGYDSETGVWTIQPDSTLTELRDDGTVIDGSSQADFIGNDTNPFGPEIEIDGSNTTNASGIGINSADNLIKELVINRFSEGGWGSNRGIVLWGDDATGNVIVGCYIGTDATGMVALGNANGGITITDGASGNRIGGPTVAERNLICGTSNLGNIITGNGISIGHIGGGSEMGEDNNIVIGNYIGVNREGTATLPNRMHGICIYQSSGNSIGGTNPGEGNIIAGNNGNGIAISNSKSSDNIVAGNYIGTNTDGTPNMGNTYHGIVLSNGTHHNTVGPENVIAYNGSDGVHIEMDSTVSNTITENSITNNGNLGINTDSGGNIELDPPEITLATESEASGTTCPGCTVEIFSDSDDEGETYEGTVTADGSGVFTLAVTVTGPYVTATATDGDGNTSEFSIPYAFSVCERGDVNCDGNITPGDALCAFWRSILGSFQEECECSCSDQAAEINCDGNITPGDALCIFWRAILGDWTDECQCPAARTVGQNPVVEYIRVKSTVGVPGEVVSVPIVVENPQGLDAFALRVMYSADLLKFQHVSTSTETKDWIALDGVVIESGVIQVGGFHIESLCSNKPTVIAELIFSVNEVTEGGSQFQLTGFADDLIGATVKNGGFVIRELPTTCSLSQNYPNPFNPTTSIQYYVVSDQTTHHSPLVTLKIYNILGQEVRTLVDQVQEPGHYSITWDGRGEKGYELPSGLYFYRLTSGNFSAAKRMVLMK
jgi:hypothetical protein